MAKTNKGRPRKLLTGLIPVNDDGVAIIKVPLTQGRYAIIDAADLPLLGDYAKIYLHHVIAGCESEFRSRRLNLRLATHSQNSKNRRMPKSNTSGTKGVHWEKGCRKWRAQICVNYKKIMLGCFDTKAQAAYVEAANKYHGEFANVGPRPD